MYYLGIVHLIKFFVAIIVQLIRFICLNLSNFLTLFSFAGDNIFALLSTHDYVSFMNPQDCLSNDTSFASSSVSMLDLDLHHVLLVSIDVMVGPSLVREIEDSSSLVVSSPSLPLLPSASPSTILSRHCQPTHLMVTW